MELLTTSQTTIEQTIPLMFTLDLQAHTDYVVSIRHMHGADLGTAVQMYAYGYTDGRDDELRSMQVESVLWRVLSVRHLKHPLRAMTVSDVIVVCSDFAQAFAAHLADQKDATRKISRQM